MMSGDDRGGCKHEVLFGNLCAVCGEDLQLRFSTAGDATRNRALHSREDVWVDSRIALGTDEHRRKVLTAQRRLALVLDLDHTLLHTIPAANPGSPLLQLRNHYIALPEEKVHAKRVDNSDYLVKLRPGLTRFLEKVSPGYEVHVYTHGSRSYAAAMVDLIDPARQVVGQRVVSRDDCSEGAAKSLKRIFPSFHGHAVVVDDTRSVWGEEAPVLQVHKYRYWGTPRALSYDTEDDDGRALEGIAAILTRLRDLYYGGAPPLSSPPEDDGGCSTSTPPRALTRKRAVKRRLSHPSECDVKQEGGNEEEDGGMVEEVTPAPHTVTHILDKMHGKVFAGASAFFYGWPSKLSVDLQRRWGNYGGTVAGDVTSCTHFIPAASRMRGDVIDKVRALGAVVTTKRWMDTCASQLQRVDETPYLASCSTGEVAGICVAAALALGVCAEQCDAVQNMIGVLGRLRTELPTEHTDLMLSSLTTCSPPPADVLGLCNALLERFLASIPPSPTP